MSTKSNFDADVIVVGAGPVGLTIANTLGLHGVGVLLLENGDALIDYPRAVGMDDECLRTIHGIGLIDAVQQHLTPFHWMRFVNASCRVYASIEPRTDEFGWSRRNVFNQPMVDLELLQGLKRFPNAQVSLSTELESFEQDEDGVTLKIKQAGTPKTLRCRYLVGSDGGRSVVRTQLGVGFGGFADTSQWLVVDIRNDLLGVPYIYMHSDPKRPYVSVALPDGVRRFEFMVWEGETEEEITAPARMAELLSKVLPAGTDIDKLDFIRKRVYTHNARIADRWCVGRVMLSGDAAHIMPVWHGQGYNTGMRDATNLAWKLDYVVKGMASETLLETYNIERPPHAKAMIGLSVAAGRIFYPRNLFKAAFRDASTWLLNLIPPVKRYFSEMRYKPMPFYPEGVVVHEKAARKNSPVGRLFIQPRVRTQAGEVKLLDDVIGKGFALLAWGADPDYWLTPRSRTILAAMDARIFTVKPVVQMQRKADISDQTEVIGDEQMRLKDWFGEHPGSVALLRPDRFVAGIAYPIEINELLEAVAGKMGLQVAANFAPAATRQGPGAA